MSQEQEAVKTLVIDNFRGPMTMYLHGDINSGHSYEQTSSGQNPFLKPGQLTWCANPVQIDSDGLVVTDLIMDGKERVENGILYVYAIGSTGRLYKIQVNDPTTYNPDYDNPVLLTTLTVNSPTFKYGGSIDFFGMPEKIYIGHDVGATSVNFNGTGEAFVGVPGSWTQNVPRPIQQFVGKMYFGNGSNLAEVDSTLLVTTYAKFSPGFPTNTQVRDIDVSVDGNYLETVVSTLPLFDITSPTQETTSTASANSFIFKWNGTDTGYTSFTTFPSFALSSNILFQDYQYTFGTDQFGSAIYAPTEKIITVAEAPAPLPNAVASTGNLLMVMTPLYYASVLQSYMLMWGSNDFEQGHPYGFWSPMFMSATAPETDIVRVPYMQPVSNTGFGASSNNYINNVFGTSKVYFSQLETSSSTTKYRLYKWSINTSALQSPPSDALNLGFYQTQTQLFSKKVQVKEVRIYSEGWSSGNSFQLDLLGSAPSVDSNGNPSPIANGSYTFTAGAQIGAGGTTMTIGDDFAWWNPQCAPTYALGIGITNLGETNYVINKIEIDYAAGGQ